MRRVLLLASVALLAGCEPLVSPAEAAPSSAVLELPLQAAQGIAPPSTEIALALFLYGDCSGTGSLNITSTGTSATIATLKQGYIYSLSCDAAVHWRQGTSATVSFTATPTTFGEKLAASPDKTRFISKGVDLAIISVAGTANCVVTRCK